MPSEPIDPAGPNVGNNPPANQNIEEVKNESGAPSPRISQDVTDKTNEVSSVPAHSDASEARG